ncbi:MAG: hypothetical protein K9L85_00980 [Candidatus Peribacteraceae bacterium]|nr:hypothetical protein [Candidatus Peribacteraceae bacterium]
MFQKNSLKKILVLLPLGIVSVTGVLFCWNSGEVQSLDITVSDLNPIEIVTVADLSEIDWEIEIVEEWQVIQN